MKNQNILNLNNCPVCGVSLLGNPIPEEFRREHGNRKHYTRLVECIDWKTNRKTGYECPDCGEYFKNGQIK
jgi:ribosomal protein L32